MQDMKFKVTSPEHSEQIQRKLFDNGCRWCSFEQTVQNTHKPCLYVENNYISYSSDDGGTYEFFNGEAIPEGILTPQGEFMLAEDYYKYPETEYAKRFPCAGCRPGYCIGCGDVLPQTKSLQVGSLASLGGQVGVLSTGTIDTNGIKFSVDSIGNVEKTYEPLPIVPISEWLSDRMKILAEHISYNLANNLSVDNKITRELHVLNVLLRDFEEVK